MVNEWLIIKKSIKPNKPQQVSLESLGLSRNWWLRRFPRSRGGFTSLVSTHTFAPGRHDHLVTICRKGQTVRWLELKDTDAYTQTFSMISQASLLYVQYSKDPLDFFIPQERSYAFWVVSITMDSSCCFIPPATTEVRVQRPGEAGQGRKGFVGVNWLWVNIN